MEHKREERQAEIFLAMAQPDFYPHPVAAVEQRETHISKVFLTGPYAYKIKKPVNLKFLDFTTLEKRRYYCEQEIILNRRLTQNVYLEVVPITYEDDHYYLAGPGSPVEYAVKMRQLPQRCSMAHLLRAGKLDHEIIDRLARLLAKFYEQASCGEHIKRFGSWETVLTNCEENFSQLAPFSGYMFGERIFQIIRAATRSFLHRRKAIFLNRVEGQKIRDCHGDLRAGHIYFCDGIQVIDCIEFNNRFRYGDVASDLAFLAMDLDHEGFSEIAFQLLHAYVHYTHDQDLFVLTDFYKCYRAVVRVKVNCLRIKGDKEAQMKKEKILHEIREYIQLAYRYAIEFSRPAIWVVCGLPAVGKTTIAQELANALSSKVLSSDVIRKELFGLPTSKMVDISFQEGIYSKEASDLTYGRLLLQAQEEIQTGHSVVLDATFSSRHHRKEVIRMAKDMDANIMFVECVCPDSIIKERLKKREEISSVSDARLHHFEKMKRAFEPLNELGDEIHIRVHTDRSLKKNMAHILSQDYYLLSEKIHEMKDQ